MVKEKCDQGDVREEINGKWRDGLSLGGQRLVTGSSVGFARFAGVLVSALPKHCCFFLD
jgi:hypothetical protein